MLAGKEAEKVAAILCSTTHSTVLETIPQEEEWWCWTSEKGTKNSLNSGLRMWLLLILCLHLLVEGNTVQLSPGPHHVPQLTFLGKSWHGVVYTGRERAAKREAKKEAKKAKNSKQLGEPGHTGNIFQLTKVVRCLKWNLELVCKLCSSLQMLPLKLESSNANRI